MIKILKILVLNTFIITSCSAAFKSKSLCLGGGVGLDYGGFGARMSYAFNSRAEVFGGLGYNLNNAGTNIGMQFSVWSKQNLNVFVSGMYGFNTVLLVKGNAVISEPDYGFTYFGPTIGSGIDWKPGKSEFTYFKFQVLMPFRPKAFNDAAQVLRTLNYEIKEPWPVGLSIGFHYFLFKK